MLDPVKVLQQQLPEALKDVVVDPSDPRHPFVEPRRGVLRETSVKEEMRLGGEGPWSILPIPEPRDELSDDFWRPASIADPVVFDADETNSRVTGRRPCAWYWPYHLMRRNWGIYIRTQCVLDIAMDLAPTIAATVQWLRQAKTTAQPRQVMGLVLNDAGFPNQLGYQFGLAYFFYHELFHHNAESFATRIELVTKTPFYLPNMHRMHQQTIYTPQCTTTPHCLEEALAQAYALSKISSREFTPWRRVYEAFKGEPNCQQALKYLHQRIEDYFVRKVAYGLPHYRLGAWIHHKVYQHNLAGNVLLDLKKTQQWWQEECRQFPSQPSASDVSFWELSSRMMHGYANFRTRKVSGGSRFWRVL